MIYRVLFKSSKNQSDRQTSWQTTQYGLKGTGLNINQRF